MKRSFSKPLSRISVLCAALCCFCLTTWAQSPPGWAWAKRIGDFGSSEENKGRGIGTDAAGNVYMLGDFTGTITLDGLSATTMGETDIFLAKYTPAGSLLWLRQLGSRSIENAGNLTVDPAGNCTLTGLYGLVDGNDLVLPNGQLLAGPVSAGVPPQVGARYGRFAFAASFDALGDVRWATRFTPEYGLMLTSMASDEQGNSYVSGYAFRGLTIAGQNYPQLGSNDGFLLKLSNTGQIQWFRRAGASGVYCSGDKVFTDNAGAVYWTYYANGPIRIGTTPGYASTPAAGAPIVKISPTNRLLWIRSVAAATGTQPGNGLISLLGIDKTSNTLLCGGEGRDGTTLTFAGYLPSITAPPGNTAGLFVATADTAGQVTWARQLGSSPIGARSSWAQMRSVLRNSRQELVLTIEMNSSLAIPSYGTIASPQAGFLIVEYASGSDLVRSARLAEMSVNSYGYHAGTVIDAQDNVLLAASFMGTARFGSISLTSLISVRRDACFAKLDQTVLSNRKLKAGLPWAVYPNPARQSVMVSGLPTGAQLRLTDAQGRTVRVYEATRANGERRLPLEQLAAGLYMLHAETTDAIYAPQKLLVQ